MICLEDVELARDYLEDKDYFMALRQLNVIIEEEVKDSV